MCDFLSPLSSSLIFFSSSIPLSCFSVISSSCFLLPLCFQSLFSLPVYHSALFVRFLLPLHCFRGAWGLRSLSLAHTKSACSTSKFWLLGSPSALRISLLAVCIMLQKTELRGRLFQNQRISKDLSFQKQHYHEHALLGDGVCFNLKEIFILAMIANSEWHTIVWDKATVYSFLPYRHGCVLDVYEM